MTTIQYVAATAMSLVVFVGMTNSSSTCTRVASCGRRSTKVRGPAAPVDVSSTECEQRARDVLSNLLGGRDGPVGARVVPRDRRGDARAQPVFSSAGGSPRCRPGLSCSTRRPPRNGSRQARRPPARNDTEAGFVATELTLGLGLLILPVALLVLTLPGWSERQTTARVIARETARTLARDGRCEPDVAVDLAARP